MQREQENWHTSLVKTRYNQSYHCDGDDHNGKPEVEAAAEDILDWNILDNQLQVVRAVGMDTLTGEEADTDIPHAVVEAAQTGTPPVEGIPSHTLENRTTQLNTIDKKEQTFNQRNDRENEIWWVKNSIQTRIKTYRMNLIKIKRNQKIKLDRVVEENWPGGG